MTKKTERGKKRETKQNEKGPTHSAFTYRQKHSLPHLVRDVLVLVQEHFELADADVQVSVCVLVGNVKAQRAKFPSLQSNSMEETQRQEQRLEVCCLERRGEESRGEESNKLEILSDTRCSQN